MSLLDGVLKEAFMGVKPSWRKLFLGELKLQLSTCFKKLEAVLKKCGVSKTDIDQNGLAYYMRPEPENILTAFKFCEIEDIKCIIIGQDPYPAAEHAHGLSFSVPYGEKIPPSLSKIYSCLLKKDIISEKPTNGNLEKWAKQGVLLLNRYLTRNPQIKKGNDTTHVATVISDGGSNNKNLHPFWSEFTDAIVKHMCQQAEARNSYMCLMLWGQKAQEVVAAIPEYVMSDKINIKIWGHPSTMNAANQTPGPNNFDNCTHFTDLNEELVARNLQQIDWNPCESKPVKPESKPTKPESKPAKSESKPAKSKDEKPESKPTKSKDVKEKPESKPVKSEPTPTKSESKPTKSESNPTKSKDVKEKPESTPTKSKDEKPESKPTKSKDEKPKETKKVVVFTDGGCAGNGKSYATASYGTHFPEKFNEVSNGYVGNISGLVPGLEIMDIQKGVIIQGKKRITPSNNRGELLGVIMALDVIIYNTLNGPWLIVMDSEYCMHMINERIWKWYKKDATFSQWANPDLVNILYKQLLKLQELRGNKPLLQPAAATYYTKKTPMNLEWDGLTILHQESHKDPPTDPFKLALWEGNDVADKLCDALLR
jgi:uracil-DNA glycosylase